MSCCACCCFYPKYKRKVDNIYPRSLDAPLIKIEVEKLQYYVKQHPEKLSKVGEFLYQHLKWGLAGSYKNRNYVKNTVEAVDKILLVITPQNLNYYATNYLKIIQKLLEQGGANIGSTSMSDGINTNQSNNANSDYLEYQKLAASLFRKFCDKEASNQSTSNYNLNYDTFVCQFSSMCYNNNKDDSVRAEIRSSGLQCLATMVKRLVPDESLSAGFLWDNMDKIVPGLLFIMHESYLKGGNNVQSEQDENMNEDDVSEMDHNLDRYLYGDFFIHSRTNNCLSAEQEVSITTAETDGVKIEFRKNSIAMNSEKGEGNTDNMTASNSEEAGAVFLLNRKNSLEVVDPDHEAKMLLKNLALKADYTTISKIVLPILNYLDANKPSGWEYSKFVRCVFLILMYNVKQQHAIVIKELIKHLDSHINSSAKLKCHIIRAIITCIRIAAMHSVGTAGQITETFTYLLKHLKSSVEKASTLRGQLISKKNPSITSPSSGSLNPYNAAANSSENLSKLNKDLTEEQNLQRKIIDAMGQFTANLPDYSKNDVIMFIARQINSQQFNYIDLATNNQSVQPAQQNIKDQQNTQLRAKYFECLYEICTKYRPTQLFSAFTNVPFLEDILRLTLVADWASRRKAHEILHLLLDKYQFLQKIKTMKPNLFNELLNSSSGLITIKKDNLLNKSINSLKNAGSTNSLNNKGNTSKSTSATSLNKITRNQTYLSQLDLNNSNLTSSREDVQFMRKYGRILLAHLNENLFLSNNRRENYESIFLTTCLFLIGLFNENEFLVDLVRFGFHVQELALLNYDQTSNFSFTAHCNVHKFVCAFFLLLSKFSNIPAFYDYVSEMCDLRRKKSLYYYLYPEYVLMNTATISDSGIQSQRQSLTEIETDFKRELKDSALEYVNIVKKYENEKNKSVANKESEENLDVKTSKENESKPTVDLEKCNKLAPWLFNKKIIADILEESGYSTSILHQPNSEYSLSVGYLQQTVTSLQTALRFRSPYSISVDSISNLPTDPSTNFNQSTSGNQQIPHSISGNITSSLTNNNLSEFHHHSSHKHNRGFSTSGQGFQMGTGIGPSLSTHQIGSTPRRSIDVDSNSNGDDTSYDSGSQYSMDQHEIEDGQKLFYIDPASGFNDYNQITINSAKQYQDLSSFETIRRVLMNGNNNGASAGASLVNGNPASSSSSMNYRSNSQLRNQNDHISGDDQPDLQLEKSIISDFKQKTFDEQKQAILRTNQAYLNNEKYQEVFEFISKELTSGVGNQSNNNNLSNNTQTNVAITQPTKSNLNSINIDSSSNISNLADNANSSVSVNSLNSTPSITVNGHSTGSQMIPLNDIEFPKLFMY